MQSKIIFIDVWRVWKVLQEPAFEMWLAQEEHKSWMYVSDLICTHFDNSKYVKYACIQDMNSKCFEIGLSARLAINWPNDKTYTLTNCKEINH